MQTYHPDWGRRDFLRTASAASLPALNVAGAQPGTASVTLREKFF